MYIIQKWGQNLKKMGFGYAFSPKKLRAPPYRAKNQNSQIQALLYSKRPALQRDYNEAIPEIIRVCGAEISSKTRVKQPNQTKPSIFATYQRISQPHELGLIHGLLRCNRVAEPVILNTIKPIFENFDFLAYRGGAKLKSPKRQCKMASDQKTYFVKCFQN